MAAKLYKDLTPAEQKARDAELTNIVRGAKDVGAGIVKEEVFGIPGMFADLSGLAQYVTNPFTYGTSEKLQTASEDLIGDLGASALAAKAGVELSDEIFDEEGNIRPEMVGRFLAPGALYAKGAALAPGIGKLFAKATKTRGSGTEVKGSGNIEMEAPPSDLEPLPNVSPAPRSHEQRLSSLREDRERILALGDREAAFSQTAKTQRALPEGQMTRIQGKMGGGVMNYAIEHGGDLLHRMTDRGGSTALGDTAPKVKGLLRSLESEYGFKREFDENLLSNYSFSKKTAEEKGQTFTQSFEEYQKEISDDLDKYADFHAELPVFNELQRAARDAAVSIGRQDFSEAIKNLRILDDAIEDGSFEAKNLSFSIKEAPPKKEVLEGEVVGTKSKKYMKLEKEMGEARTPELRAARELNMETQGVEDAFDLNAASNIDKNFDFASGGDDVRATSDEFIGGVIDEYQGARDQGFNRGDALVDAVRVKVTDYNKIYPDALDLNSVLDDLSRNVNDDFGFDQALGRFREGQSNRKALEAELQTAKFKNMREAQAAATRVREEQLGIAGLSDAEKAAFYRNMGEQEQRGIAGIGIPEPETPKPILRLIKSNLSPREARDYNQEVQDALSDYATGKNTARQTQSTLKKLGYQTDLREGRSTGDIQVYKRGVEDDPGVFYEFRDGGKVDMRSGIGDLFKVYS